MNLKFLNVFKASLLVFIFVNSYRAFASSELIEFHGYKNCIRLANKTSHAILSGECGGRVLEYSLKGKNVIYQNRKNDGWLYVPGKPWIEPPGGRFDIGPELTIPKHPKLWVGKWKAEITGDFSARLLSPKNKATGTQLTLDFTLAHDSSQLTIKQTVTNISNEPIICNYWGRTLVPSGGICIVPLAGKSRFPFKYIMYEGDPADKINIKPTDENIVKENKFLIIKDFPKYPKLGFDSQAGWLAYICPNDVAFIKEFHVYPERAYSGIAGITLCVYYHQFFCELEPLGPEEKIGPGQSISFVEIWRLAKFPFSKNLDLNSIKQLKR